MLFMLFVAAAAAAEPSSLPVYPEEWIFKARTDNMKLSCQELVYKKGCAVTRTGRVALHVTLDQEGHVQALKVTKNAMSRDKKVVEQCLLKNVKKWQWTPPVNVSPEVDVEVLFGDKC